MREKSEKMLLMQDLEQFRNCTPKNRHVTDEDYNELNDIDRVLYQVERFISDAKDQFPCLDEAPQDK